MNQATPPSAAVAPGTGIVASLLRTLPDDRSAFASRSAAIANWDVVLDAARNQGVLGVLAHYWSETDGEVPPRVLDAAERHCAIEQLWTRQVRSAAEEALARLAAGRVPCVALKGPVLAERLYPDPLARPSIDLDLLVDPRDFQSATAALEDLGYREQEGPGAEYARRHEHHLHFRRPNSPEIELHFRLYAGFGTVLDAADAIARAVEHGAFGATPVRVLAPEDEIFYLALHAAGHSYVRLLWLYDLKLLLRACPRVAWTTVAERARAHGVLTAVAFTLQLLAERLAAPAPRPGDLGVASGLRWRLATRLLPVVMKPTVRSARENLESLLFTSLLCDRPRSGFGLVRHHVLRGTRRRLQRLAPRLLPEQWAG